MNYQYLKRSKVAIMSGLYCTFIYINMDNPKLWVNYKSLIFLTSDQLTNVSLPPFLSLTLRILTSTINIAMETYILNYIFKISTHSKFTTPGCLLYSAIKISSMYGLNYTNDGYKLALCSYNLSLAICRGIKAIDMITNLNCKYTKSNSKVPSGFGLRSLVPSVLRVCLLSSAAINLALMYTFNSARDTSKLVVSLSIAVSSAMTYGAIILGEKLEASENLR